MLMQSVLNSPNILTLVSCMSWTANKVKPQPIQLSVSLALLGRSRDKLWNKSQQEFQRICFAGVHDIWSKTISSTRHFVEYDYTSTRHIVEYDNSSTTTIRRNFVKNVEISSTIKSKNDTNNATSCLLGICISCAVSRIGTSFTVVILPLQFRFSQRQYKVHLSSTPGAL